MLPEVGVAGQQRLANARVLVIGAGGLGSIVSLYLTAMGVATSGLLRIVDPDTVELTNLHRQLLHGHADIGATKVLSAQATLAALNAETIIEPIAATASMDNLPEWLQDTDLVVDASDNFATRFAVHQACYATKIDLVSGAAIRWQGQLVSFLFSQSQCQKGCYECLYSPDDLAADNCSTAGVMPPVVGIIGSAQALAASRILVGHPSVVPRHAQLQCYDALQDNWRTVSITPDPACRICGS